MSAPHPAATRSWARRAFGPTVLVGLTSAGLLALAVSQTWAAAHVVGPAGEVGQAFAGSLMLDGGVTGTDAAPLAAALGWVALAAWGTLLVLRGPARRVSAVIGLLAAAGAASAVVASAGAVQDRALRGLSSRIGGDVGAASLTAWWFVAAAAAVVSVVALAVAVTTCGGWPTMSRRYDAPTPRADGVPAAPAGPARPSAPASEHPNDLWRALDAGRDPTDDHAP